MKNLLHTHTPAESPEETNPARTAGHQSVVKTNSSSDIDSSCASKKPKPPTVKRAMSIKELAIIAMCVQPYNATAGGSITSPDLSLPGAPKPKPPKDKNGANDSTAD